MYQTLKRNDSRKHNELINYVYSISLTFYFLFSTNNYSLFCFFLNRKVSKLRIKIWLDIIWLKVIDICYYAVKMARITRLLLVFYALYVTVLIIVVMESRHFSVIEFNSISLDEFRLTDSITTFHIGLGKVGCNGIELLVLWVLNRLSKSFKIIYASIKK